MIATILEIGAKIAKVEVPWKWIGVALAALAIALTIGAGYLHIENLKEDLKSATEQLAKEQSARQLAEATTNAIKAQHDVQVSRINDLEQQRYEIAVEATKLRTDIAQLNLEQDLEQDDEETADAAIGRLNGAHARLNQLLRDASGAEVRAGAAQGSKARKAGAGSYLGRALQALRQNGVSDAR